MHFRWEMVHYLTRHTFCSCFTLSFYLKSCFSPSHIKTHRSTNPFIWLTSLQLFYLSKFPTTDLCDLFVSYSGKYHTKNGDSSNSSHRCRRITNKIPVLYFYFIHISSSVIRVSFFWTFTITRMPFLRHVAISYKKKWDDQAREVLLSKQKKIIYTNQFFNLHIVHVKRTVVKQIQNRGKKTENKQEKNWKK